jgi:hypothetical protein
LGAYGGGALAGAIVGIVFCYLPLGSHVENAVHAGNVTIQSTAIHAVVHTNILGSEVGTDPGGWILLGAVIGVVVMPFVRKVRERFAPS